MRQGIRFHNGDQASKRGSFGEALGFGSPRGGGSSFDKMRFKRKAQEMKVLERYKYFQGNPEYEKFTKDAELLELSEKMFGVSYGNNT